jgi:pimeloyl-ACP methyl ester carboxylesterase
MAIARAEVEIDVRGIKTRIHYLRQDGPSNVPVLLLLHGHSSSVGEFEDLLPELDGKAVVFAFDQPCCGKSADLSHKTVADAYSNQSLSWTKGYETLFFLRDLAHAFVWKVVRPAVRASGRQVRVAGGSLGGNLSLLIAERKPKYTWLEGAFCWSPGSAWGTSTGQSLGGAVARDLAARPWDSALDKREFLRKTFVDRTVPVPVPTSYPQPWYWWWDCWGESQHPECKGQGSGGCARCQHKPKLQLPEGALLGPNDAYPGMGERKARSIEASLRGTSLSVRPARMAWHWDVAAEQVELSHLQMLQGGLRRVERIQCPTKFMAGKEDKHFPAPLFQSTKQCFDVASAHFAGVPNAPRITEHWFEHSGHSVHNERPAELGQVLLGAL